MSVIDTSPRQRYLTGSHGSTINEKGRMSFPAVFRKELGDKFFIAKNVSVKCISVYHPEDWAKLLEKLNAQRSAEVDNYRRFVLGGAVEAAPDAQGRIFVPPMLCAYAKLTKDIWVIGTGFGAEIWDKESYDAYYNGEPDSSLYDVALKFEL